MESAAITWFITFPTGKSTEGIPNLPNEFIRLDIGQKEEKGLI